MRTPLSRVLVLVAVAMSVAACGTSHGLSWRPAPEPEPAAASLAPAAQPAPVGVTVIELDLVDPSRPTSEAPGVAAAPSRALPTTVYVPPGAAAAPLVVIAHGAGGSPGKFTALADHWAEHGYLVAIPRFPLTSDLVAEPVLADFPQQALDVRFVIDEVLARGASADSPLSGRIDPERIGLFGLSLGTLTVWSEAFGDQPDPRIDALIQSDGTTFVAPERFGEITFPVLVAHSDADHLFPYAEVLAAYDRLPGEKYLLTMHGAAHATVAEDTVTPADAAYQETTAVFWARTLGGQPDAPFPASVLGSTTFVVGPSNLPDTL